MYSFLLQAILFYIPRWLWKNWEAGKIQALMMDLDLGIISEAEKRSKKKLLLDYLYANLKNHNFWAYRYFFCELLSLANVIGESTYNFLKSRPSAFLSAFTCTIIWLFGGSFVILQIFQPTRARSGNIRPIFQWLYHGFLFSACCVFPSAIHTLLLETLRRKIT